MRLQSSYILIAVVTGIVVTGCQRGTTASDVPMVLQIAPTTASIAAGQSVQFTAGRSASLAGADLRWTSSDSSLVTVSQSGLARALASVPGVQICVLAVAYPTIKACASVVVPVR